jgi:hypothetical protein
MYIILAGWILPLDKYITPGDGIGLALGIIGTTLMTLLFGYSIRKRVKFSHKIAPLSKWFKAHMWFGILGPIFILWHCRYSLGAQNSNIALWSMLTVSASGLIGRFLYRRVGFEKLFSMWHYGHLPIVYIMIGAVSFHIMAFFWY